MNSPSYQNASAQVPNHLVWAIVSTIVATCFCCPLGLLGIVAIVFSSKVNSLLQQGDIDGARQASNNAKTWCIVTSVLAVIGLIMSIIWFATGGVAQYMEAMQQIQQIQGGG
jgi:Interferon-induced transmembrane protein